MSALLSLDKEDVLSGGIWLPRRGVWHADLRLSSSGAFPVGKDVTISLDDQSIVLKGRVLFSGLFAGITSVRVLGGHGGLSTAVPAKYYRDVPARIVLNDILRECGESLAGSSDAGVLATQFKSWSRLGSSGADAWHMAIQSLGTDFRVLPDGSFRVGPESYPLVSNTGVIVLSRSRSEQRITMSGIRPVAMPGTSMVIPDAESEGAQKIDYVMHNFDESTFRSEVFLA